MGMKREEILPGVWFSYFNSNKFKTSVLSLSFLTELDRETAAMNALIPAVLTRGSTLYPDIEKIGNITDELYGVEISPVVRLIGEIQCSGFIVSFPEAKFLPVERNYNREVIDLTAELLLHPLTRGGLLNKEYVDSERQKLAENIRSLINEKASYASHRCIEEMCCYEAYAIGQYGNAEDCESINYKKLTKQYHNLLLTSPVEIIYCGSESFENMCSYLQTAFVTLPRGVINYDIGTDIRMNAVEETVRYCEEHLNVTQGKLVLGFRLGDWMENPNPAILSVFNAVYGSGVTSRLFRNVREKLQLCYYASSLVYLAKGIMLVSAGIDFDRFETAKNEILFQLEDISKGNITEEEMEWARASVLSNLRSIPDSPVTLESYFFRKLISGAVIDTDEYAEAVKEVTLQDITELAGSIIPDMIYFLRNDPESSEETEDTVE